MTISPALLLATLCALLYSAVVLMIVRLPLYWLAVLWALSLFCFVLGQGLAAIMAVQIWVVGTLDVGAGVLCSLIASATLLVSKVWYDRRHQRKGIQ